MRLWMKAGIVVTALLLAGQASAIDMCFQTGGGVLFVAKSYKRPSAGKCRPLTGYEGSQAKPHPATGTVCLNAYGTTLYVHWNVQLYDGYQDLVHYSSRTELPYPSLTNGTSTFTLVRPSGTDDGYFNGSAYRCEPAPLP